MSKFLEESGSNFYFFVLPPTVSFYSLPWTFPAVPSPRCLLPALLWWQVAPCPPVTSLISGGRASVHVPRRGAVARSGALLPALQTRRNLAGGASPLAPVQLRSYPMSSVPMPPPRPLATTSLFSVSVSLFLFCFVCL